MRELLASLLMLLIEVDLAVLIKKTKLMTYAYLEDVLGYA